MTGFWLLFGVLEGLGSSGRLIGSISTYPGTYKSPWSLVMVKNPEGGNFVFQRPYDRKNKVFLISNMDSAQTSKYLVSKTHLRLCFYQALTLI